MLKAYCTCPKRTENDTRTSTVSLAIEIYHMMLELNYIVGPNNFEIGGGGLSQVFCGRLSENWGKIDLGRCAHRDVSSFDTDTQAKHFSSSVVFVVLQSVYGFMFCGQASHFYSTGKIKCHST